MIKASPLISFLPLAALNAPVRADVLKLCYYNALLGLKQNPALALYCLQNKINSLTLNVRTSQSVPQ